MGGAAIMISVLWAVSLMIPDEEAAANRAGRNRWKDLRDSIVAGGCPMASRHPPVFGSCYWIWRSRRSLSQRRNGHRTLPARNLFGWSVVWCFAFAFLLLALFTVIINPYRYFRTATVGRETVVFSSVYRSWTIPRSGVQGAVLLRNTRIQARKPKVDLRLVVTAKNGDVFRSVRVEGLRPGGPTIKKYEALVESLSKHSGLGRHLIEGRHHGIRVVSKQATPLWFSGGVGVGFPGPPETSTMMRTPTRSGDIQQSRFTRSSG